MQVKLFYLIKNTFFQQMLYNTEDGIMNSLLFKIKSEKKYKKAAKNRPMMSIMKKKITK